jgi:two-component response regulator (ARR-A family)
MIDCCKLESAAVVQVNTCHDTTHRVGTGDYKAEVELSVIEESRAECPQPDRISEISLPSISNSEYHVLTVDDSKIDQKVIERLLKTSSYKVTTVNSAVRALEYLGLSESCPSPGKANRVSVNLIMTDYCMPEMTGYDLLKIVKASSAFKEVPVIVMSSENDSNRIKSCLAEGAEEFIIKPVQMEDVKRLRGHIRPCTGPSESSNSSIRGKRKSPDGLQPTSPARRARYSGVAVA